MALCAQYNYKKLLISEPKNDKDKKKKKEEPSSAFQRQRVDDLLVELTKKFPHKIPSQAPQAPGHPAAHAGATTSAVVGTAAQSVANPADSGIQEQSRISEYFIWREHFIV